MLSLHTHSLASCLQNLSSNAQIPFGYGGNGVENSKKRDTSKLVLAPMQVLYPSKWAIIRMF